MNWLLFGMAWMNIIANAFAHYCIFAALFNCIIDKEFLPTLFKFK
jgi:hypothetical protein